jgi:hypothetical protein
MLDTNAIQQLVENQVKQEVSNHVAKSLNDQWLKTVENNAIKFIQDRIVAKFSNSQAMPELIDAVKSSVSELFQSGQLPGLGQYVDYDFIKQSVNDKTQELVQSAIQELSVDPKWLEKIESQINQQMTQRVVATLGSTDIRSMVNQQLNDVSGALIKKLIPGIQDHSKKVELTLLDDNVVVENTLTARDITAVDSVTVKNLVVKGSINTDNQSWQILADSISQSTLDKLSDQWKQTLTQQVANTIKDQGIEFNSVTIDGVKLVDGNKLSGKITESNLQAVGELKQLVVLGETSLNNTVNVVNKRLGVNTNEPEMALSVWDEEVAVIAGKYKNNNAYIGTSRKQSLTIGINKKPAIEISDQGLTVINQLQVGIHKISHANEVPNYSGSKGDIVFNASPTLNSDVFAWHCLGGFKWKVIRAVQ